MSGVQKQFYEAYPFVYTYDDHDTGVNNANAKEHLSVLESHDAYRKAIPSYELPDHGIYHSF